MNVVFLGTPRSAVPTLEALLDAGHRVRLVVTRPDRPAGRSSRPEPPPVKRAALARGIEVLQPEKIRDAAFLEAVASPRPDALVVVAYGRILPAPVLACAPLGAVNVHFSLLPRYRGAAPVQWTLARGETVTGVTTMRMNERLDEGDVLRQRETAIAAGEHAPALLERLAELGAGLLVDTLEALGSGRLVARPQNPALATYAPALTREDGNVDPALSAAEIEGRVRGFDPWPGVWVRGSGRPLRIVRAAALAGASTTEPPGRVLDLGGGGFRVACGGGSVLEIREIQPEGRRQMSARDAFNGRLMRPGDALERHGPA